MLLSKKELHLEYKL